MTLRTLTLPLLVAALVWGAFVHPAMAEESLERLPAVPGSDPLWQPSVLEDEPAPYSTREYVEADPGEQWTWQMLPQGLIYHSYLAGAKEPRLATIWQYERDEGWLWDIALGGRAGIVRYGTSEGPRFDGWQLDLEGAAFPRLDIEQERDLVSADFRAGVPLTYGAGRYQTKVAFYHLSSHLGDEYMVRNPTVDRINYSRDVMVWGHSYYWHDDLRLYAEVGYAVISDVSEPWEYQAGIDYSPLIPPGFQGSPFAAVNLALREEVAFGGNWVVQAGWQWRGYAKGQRLRTGVQYFNGKDDQFEFYDQSQQKVGIGIWYDF